MIFQEDVVMKNQKQNKKSDKSHKLMMAAPSDRGRRYQLTIYTLSGLYSIISRKYSTLTLYYNL